MKLHDKLIQSPIFLCGFRPFFVLTASFSIAYMALWLISLQGGLGHLNMPGGWLMWHAHELVFGVFSAATAGFALTSIAEFTSTTPIQRKPLFYLVIIWLLARLFYVLSPWLTTWPALLFNLLFWSGILYYIVPASWQQRPIRKHISFGFIIAALMLLEIGFFFSLNNSTSAHIWLYAAVHLYMMLIIVAASRVSMSVLNKRVEADKYPDQPKPETLYLARPPRRYFAISIISLCALSEFFLGANPATGWLAMAVMAAVFGMLNDWHIGRQLLDRFSLMLYASYWMIALGYGLLGASYLGADVLPSAGRHLLTAGAMTLSTFAIMSIVSRIHSGLWLDRRLWLPITAVVFVVAALVRTYAGFYGALTNLNSWLLIAGGLWMLGYLLYAVHFFKVLMSNRKDGRAGCDGPEPVAG